MSLDLSINIIANAALGTSLSGGDNIFIEFARRWAKAGRTVNIFVWEEGFQMCQRRGLTGVNFILWPAMTFKKFGFFVLYIARIAMGCWHALKIRLLEPCFIYSASDFWQDVLPAFLMKCRYPKARWIAGFYMFAPAPWNRNSPYRGLNFFRGFIYWITQSLSYSLVKLFADKVFVTSDPDVRHFVTPRRPAEHIFVVKGGVDITPSKVYISSGAEKPLSERTYDACFVGRFHYQKGVLELVDIWRQVVMKRSASRLVMVGDGPLVQAVRDKIRRYNLEGNIELTGYRNGQEKFEIFKDSRMVLHPATYDSGGMAAAEAMAWGLPGVSFDLEALKTYYPKGMLKVRPFDLDGFAVSVIKLLDDKAFYENMRQEAVALVRTKWDWDSRAQDALEHLEA